MDPSTVLHVAEAYAPRLEALLDRTVSGRTRVVVTDGAPGLIRADVGPSHRRHGHARGRGHRITADPSRGGGPVSPGGAALDAGPAAVRVFLWSEAV